MTGPERHTDQSDDAVSAVLDGVATADEVARVHSDPHLRERLAEFAALRAAIQAPAPAPAARRDAAVAAALAATAAAATPSPAGSTENGSTGAPAGDQLAQRRARRAPAPWLVGVAAAALLLVGVAGRGLFERDSSTTVALAPTSTTPALDSRSAAPTMAGAGTSAGGTATAGTPEQLGTFASLQDLRTAVRSRRLAEADSSGATGGAAGPVSPAQDAPEKSTNAEFGSLSSPPCPQGPEEVLSTYNATVDGTPVVVQVLATSEGQVMLVRTLDCGELLRTQL